MDFNDMLDKALEGTVSDLRRQPGPIREREFEDALLVAYSERASAGHISRQARVTLDGFRSVGNCDVAVMLPGPRTPILLELKWARGRSTTAHGTRSSSPWRSARESPTMLT